MFVFNKTCYFASSVVSILVDEVLIVGAFFQPNSFLLKAVR